VYCLVECETGVGYYILKYGKIINVCSWYRLEEVCQELASREVIVEDFYNGSNQPRKVRTISEVVRKQSW